VAQKTIVHLLKRLKTLRKKHELTQEQFAELSGIGYKYYQAVEGGRKRDLRLSTLERISDAYGIQVFQLLAPAEPASKIPKKSLSKRAPQKK
jgi:transcriptional regulator with XRE-family HTH domain